MGKGVKTVCFLLGLVFLAPGIFPQDAKPGANGEQAGAAENRTAPDLLRRPERGESPRYPQDIVIGELGQGKAPDGAYRYAKELIEALAAGSNKSPVVTAYPSILTESLLKNINGIGPRSYRLGGGRTEADGNVSFLVRFLGSEESITGELFIHQEGAPAAAPVSGEAAPASGEAAPASGEAAPVSGEAAPASGEAAPVSGEAAPAAGKVSPDSKWVLDDLVLEEKKALSEINDSYRYDFSPYERLY